MITAIDTATLVKPNRQESKAQATDAAARAIIDAETARRDAKTERLRAARLKMEAAAEVAPPAALKKAKPAARKRAV